MNGRRRKRKNIRVRDVAKATLLAAIPAVLATALVVWLGTTLIGDKTEVTWKIMTGLVAIWLAAYHGIKYSFIIFILVLTGMAGR
jgi:hypothetical protein